MIICSCFVCMLVCAHFPPFSSRMHRKNGQFASLKDCYNTEGGTWETSNGTPHSESMWVEGYYSLVSVPRTCIISWVLFLYKMTWSLVFCGHLFLHFSLVFVDVNTVGSMRRTPQQCVGDLLVQELFAMPVALCGQIR